MLVLSRKRDEAIVIDGNIRITVVSIQGNQVRIGLEAPTSVSILREELCDRTGTGGERARLTSTGAATGSRSSR